ncbi:hypothetical protein [Clostridium pasteurianum]|uniref:Uncharacterized protein n=1 Tax=Clostridium pasteurianum BC1 TaxID=86416 RepID=R4KA82_CLOPA|nr:hypothetical protein [Clostridium pasteurianum]AGK98601.1 hypothetical protein Clopa_3842 [Clostridium pasteurianum BC1]
MNKFVVNYIDINFRVRLIKSAKKNIFLQVKYLQRFEIEAILEMEKILGRDNIVIWIDKDMNLSTKNYRVLENLKLLHKLIDVTLCVKGIGINILSVDDIVCVYYDCEYENNIRTANGFMLDKVSSKKLLDNRNKTLSGKIPTNLTKEIIDSIEMEYLNKVTYCDLEVLRKKIQFINIRFNGIRFSDKTVGINTIIKSMFSKTKKEGKLLNKWRSSLKVFYDSDKIKKVSNKFDYESKKIKKANLISTGEREYIILKEKIPLLCERIKEFNKYVEKLFRENDIQKQIDKCKQEFNKTIEEMKKEYLLSEYVSKQDLQDKIEKVKSFIPDENSIINSIKVSIAYYDISIDNLKDKDFLFSLLEELDIKIKDGYTDDNEFRNFVEKLTLKKS